ncbi:leucine zipper putative tumor suppressor 2 homolog [Dendroctonus ponderosae]|nr:leucine zipper putative tumor suppressor 2 homolog [Dendroctonus ponderosae]KAH1012662.1 hypothetical protein HUJ05_011781 [Dendroctonus ponderosae]
MFVKVCINDARTMTSCTTDSGTETLFSDESPCDLIRSPSICSEEEAARSRNGEHEDVLSINSKLGPPNIQPYSGVLEKGKVVIKPIAFKPSAPNLSTSSRNNDRYGSTPILARPSSRLNFYGSTSELHRDPNLQNHSLDRRLRSTCTSTNSSPPLAMSSLPSIPHTHKLLNCDSLESVRKSPGSNIDYSLLHKNAYTISASNIGSLLDLTPSPSDSGVSELEAALRDRDSELAFLRQTMEHNEQVIFRVYQEKEKIWERELHKLKSMYDSRIRASAEKALKLEQLLMMQSYQQNQDKRRLIGDVQKVNFQNDKLRNEVEDLRSRLEETEWCLCQKTGEIALLKTQLKDCQTEHSTKCQELLQLRIDLRELQQHFDELEEELNKQKSQNLERDGEIADMQIEVESLRCQLRKYESMESIDKTRFEDISETDRLKAEIKELREELSDLSISDYSNIQPGRFKTDSHNQDHCSSYEDLEIQQLNGEYIECCNEPSEVGRLRRELIIKTQDFNREKLIWAQEKEKVLRYQRQLQMNYVQIYRRSKALEAELDNLTTQIAIENSIAKDDQIVHAEIAKSIEL